MKKVNMVNMEVYDSLLNYLNESSLKKTYPPAEIRDFLGMCLNRGGKSDQDKEKERHFSRMGTHHFLLFSNI